MLNARVRKVVLNLFMAWFTLQASAEEIDWMTNLDEALKKAKAEKKVVLLDFTGSDWCGWCMKLKREVFDTPEFASYASRNVVMVEIDFPMHKPQSDDLKKQNEALQAKYEVKGYPALIILDSEGNQIGSMKYMPGGPQPFITRLKKIKNKAALKA